MRLGKASAYGVFATIFIGSHQEDGPVQGRVIAEAYGIPVEYLLKILQQLVRAQILRSERGRSGGFMLKKPANKTTLLEIVEAVDGPIDGELLVRREIQGATRAKDRIEKTYNNIADYAKTLLRRMSVADLAD